MKFYCIKDIWLKGIGYAYYVGDYMIVKPDKIDTYYVIRDSVYNTPKIYKCGISFLNEYFETLQEHRLKKIKKLLE